MTKLYQLLLFITFAIGILAQFWLQKNQLTVSASQHQTEFVQLVHQYKDYQGDGQQLFATINAIQPLQFFQYITDLNPQQNYTFGELHQSQHWLQHLLPVKITQDIQLSNARLQLSADTRSWYGVIETNIMTQTLMLLAMYLFLVISLLWLQSRIKNSIAYSVTYMSQLIADNYPPLQASKLGGECKPLAKALEQLRLDIKAHHKNLVSKHEQLNQESLQDTITGFGNRQQFTQTLAQLTSAGTSQLGTLALVKATELGAINQLYGRQAGDEYLVTISKTIKHSLREFSFSQCFRISSADFAMFIPDLSIKDAPRIFTSLKHQFDDYQQQLGSDSVAYMGIVPFTEQSNPASLLALADSAISIAQTLGPNQFHTLEHQDDLEEQGDNRWQKAIESLLDHRNIEFYQQSIQPCRHNVDMYRELLARFYNSNGKLLPTTTVFAMAERHGKNLEMDKLIVQMVIERLIKDPLLTGWYGVNISGNSVLQPDFVAWLKDTLNRYPEIAARLVIEVNEIGIQKNLVSSAHFVKAVHSAGARVSIERFGMGFTSFKFFQELRPDFVKLDGSFSNQVHLDSSNRFFIKMIVDIAKRLNVKIIATGVEVQEEKLALEQLLVDGLQGYYIAKPLALDKTP